MNEVRINFDEIRNRIYEEGAKYELYCYIYDIFHDLQDISNLDGNSIIEQLEYSNKCGSYSCDTLKTVDRLHKIYFSICDFIEEYKENTGEDLSSLYFTNIEVFELYLLYDLYYKYIQEYDKKGGE